MLRNHKMLRKLFRVLLVLATVQFCSGKENETVKPTDDEFNSTPESTPEYMDYAQYTQPCEKDDVRKFRAIFLSIMYGVVFCIGMIGNGLVMLRYIYFKRLKTGTDFYMLNLAIADIVFLFTLPFWAASIVHTWIFGEGMCKLIFCLYKMSFFSGMITLMAVSLERYVAIVQAPTAHRHRSRTVMISKIFSSVIWGVSLVLSIPELIYSGVKLVNEDKSCIIYSSDIQGLNAILKIIQMIVGFLLPLIIMAFCYSMIVLTLLHARNFEKYKAIKVIITIVFVFVVFQLPYNSVMLFKTFHNTTECQTSKKIDIADDVTYTIACLRCCLNPFLYVIIGVKFRNDLCKFLKDLGCLSQERLSDWSTAKPSRRGSFAMDTDTTTTFSP